MERFIDYYRSLVIDRGDGGGGGSATLIDKNIAENGTYNASDDSADGFKKVVVAVPEPSGTKEITANGTFDVRSFASALVSVGSSAPTYQEKTLSIRSNGSMSVTPDEGYDALSVVDLDIEVLPSLQNKSVSFSQNGSMSVSADEGYDALGVVDIVVDVPQPVIAPKVMRVTANGSFSVYPDVGDDAMSVVDLTVEVPSVSVQSIKSVTLSENGSMSILPDAGFDALACVDVTVNVSGGGGDDGYLSYVARTAISGAYTDSKISVVGKYGMAGFSEMTDCALPNCSFVDQCGFLSDGGLLTVTLDACKSLAESAFQGCYQMQTISLPECEWTIPPDHANASWNTFTNCARLSSIYAPKLKTIGPQCFVSCSSLVTVSFPAAYQVWGSAFSGCTKLQSAYFGGFLSTDLAKNVIMGSAFSACNALQTVSFPECRGVGNRAFWSLRSLAYMELPECTSIGSQAFQGCSNMSWASFPKLTTLGTLGQVFFSCSKLMSLYLLGSSVPAIGTSTFNGVPFGASIGGVYGSIFVMSSMMSAFLGATNWASMSARLVAYTP